MISCGSLHQIVGFFHVQSPLLITLVRNLHFYLKLHVWIILLLTQIYTCSFSSCRVTRISFSSYKWRAQPNAFRGLIFLFSLCYYHMHLLVLNANSFNVDFLTCKIVCYADECQYFEWGGPLHIQIFHFMLFLEAENMFVPFAADMWYGSCSSYSKCYSCNSRTW